MSFFLKKIKARNVWTYILLKQHMYCFSKIYIHTWGHSKHIYVSLYCMNVVSLSATLAQHQNNIGSTFCVCWNYNDRTSACTCSLVHLRTCVPAHLLTCALVQVYAHLPNCTLTYMRTCVIAHLHSCAFMHLLTCALKHLRKYLCTCILAYLCTCVLAYLSMYLCNCALVYLHK